MSRRCAVVPLVLVAAWGCGGEAVPESAPATDPTTAMAVADTATVAVPLTLPGQLYVEHDAVLYARAQGVVESVYADLGVAVGPGDTLAKLESVDQEIALEEARAALDNARQVVGRARSLAGTGVVSAADSEHAELEVRQAELRARRAERAYRFTRVIAPFAGWITQRQARPGRLVEPGEPLFRVVARAPLLVSVQLPERVAAAVSVGDEGAVVDLDGTSHPARVIRASPTIDAASGTREVVLRVAAGSGWAPGASVAVHVGAERRQAVVVPADALTEAGHVLVWEDGRTVLRPVTVGAALPDGRVVIIQGIAPGERVVRR